MNVFDQVFDKEHKINSISTIHESVPARWRRPRMLQLMKNTFRNPALQRLYTMSTGQYRSRWRAMAYSGDSVWSCADLSEPEMWFPEHGVLLMEQALNSGPVAVALIGCTTGVPLAVNRQGRVRTLLAGEGYVLPVADVASVCPDVLLQAQQELARQMALWAYCASHHALTQVLADRLLWMAQASMEPSIACPVDALQGCSPSLSTALGPTLHELQQAGAIELEGLTLRVVDVDILRRRACGCHASLAATASATLMPSTPADKIPPA